MQKRFEILSEEFQQNPDLLLLVDAGKYHFNVLAIDHIKNEAVAACNFEMDEHSYESLPEQSARHEIFKPNYHKAVVAYNLPESILSPAEFNLENNSRALDLLYGDLNKGNITSETVAAVPARNIYRVEQKIQEAVTLHFRVHQYYHIYSVLLNNSGLLAAGKPVIKLVFYQRQVILLAVKDQTLQLVQAFPLDKAEDIAYYLLKVCKDLGLAPAETIILAAGWINTQSTVYTEIRKYFLQVQFEEDPGSISFNAAFAEYPLHFFSPLISLASCVS